MALSSTQVKYIAIGVLAVVVILIVGSILVDLLKVAIGVIIGLGLIYLGVRFLMGKGLPKGMAKMVDKAVKATKDDEKKS
jgi:hypothetical protein